MAKKKARSKKRPAAKRKAVKRNAPKMRPGKTTGWMKAKRVKIVRKGGRVNVLVQK